MKADIDMNQVQEVIGPEELQVIHPPDFRPVRIDDLLVQKGLLQRKLPGTRRRFPKILRKHGMRGQPASDIRDSFPREKNGFAILFPEHEDIPDRRVILPDVRNQIEDPADHPPFGIDDFSPQELTDEQKRLGSMVPCVITRHDHPLRVTEL